MHPNQKLLIQTSRKKKSGKKGKPFTQVVMLNTLLKEKQILVSVCLKK